MVKFKHLTSLSSILFLVLTVILILFEIIASNMAFENFGEITSGFYQLLIFVNITPILLFVFNYKKFALVALLILGIIIIPENLIVNNRLIKLKEESSNIILFAYQSKLYNGSFPKDLKNYVFKYAELEKHISYTKEFVNHSENKNEMKDHFGLFYYVGTKSTSHFLMKSDYGDNSKFIQWYYYPD
jgi:hypothetical protein